MTVSEFKIENHKHITAEVAESMMLFDGTYPKEVINYLMLGW